ncbi:hypothetical protein FA95DRAFT_1566417 [Auriscalpium vulgare]|uniref:Uncharacterized protein n=1 Tax=Auriscalpium vulgare TaxID=40419 RepID=A0ACB8R8Q2_9AGAM|nr:hypothetical protein FA95DRAFT_1566417 [Auriscalpium vulgare]
MLSLIYPMPAPFSESFAQEIHDVSRTAAATARRILSLVYDASDGEIRLFEDQMLPAEWAGEANREGRECPQGRRG